jgi:hypothetical protein
MDQSNKEDYFRPLPTLREVVECFSNKLKLLASKDAK